jgi:hypothetical protein
MISTGPPTLVLDQFIGSQPTVVFVISPLILRTDLPRRLPRGIVSGRARTDLYKFAPRIEGKRDAPSQELVSDIEDRESKQTYRFLVTSQYVVRTDLPRRSPRGIVSG